MKSFIALVLLAIHSVDLSTVGTASNSYTSFVPGSTVQIQINQNTFPAPPQDNSREKNSDSEIRESSRAVKEPPPQQGLTHGFHISDQQWTTNDLAVPRLEQPRMMPLHPDHAGFKQAGGWASEANDNSKSSFNFQSESFQSLSTSPQNQMMTNNAMGFNLDAPRHSLNIPDPLPSQVLPDGIRRNMNGQNTRQYPHGMFHGSTSPRFVRNHCHHQFW